MPTRAIARRCHPPPSVVVAGLVPAIHAVKPPLGKTGDCLACSLFRPSRASFAASMAGTSPAMTVNIIVISLYGLGSRCPSARLTLAKVARVLAPNALKSLSRSMDLSPRPQAAL